MLLLSTYSLKWYWLHKIWEILKKSNYDWLDLYMDSNIYDLWDSEYIKKIIDLYDIKILSITSPWEWINKSKVNMIFEIAKSLWVQLVTFSPPLISDLDKTWFTKYLQEIKNEYDFNIAIQNIENKYVFFIIPKYKNMPLAEVKQITWYSSLDIANIDNNSSLDIIKALKIMGVSLKNVYLSDKKLEKYWLLPWKEKSGISNLPIESFLMQLKSNNYNWFITLKVDPLELWVWNEELILKNLERIKFYFNKYYTNFK